MLKPGGNVAPAAALKPVDATGTQIVGMDEMFPPGAGRKYMMETCLGCHSPDLFGVVDPKTGQVTEYKPPLNLSRPYDPQADYEGNVWFGDDGQGGTTIRFNTKSREFTHARHCAPA